MSQDFNKQDIDASACLDQMMFLISQLKKFVGSQSSRIEELNAIVLLLKDEHRDEINLLRKNTGEQVKSLEGRIRSLEEEANRVKVVSGSELMEGFATFPLADMSDETDESSESAKSCEEYEGLSDCEYKWGESVAPESSPTENPDEVTQMENSKVKVMTTTDDDAWSGGDEHLRMDVHDMTDDKDYSVLVLNEVKMEANPNVVEDSNDWLSGPMTPGPIIISTSSVSTSSGIGDVGDTTDLQGHMPHQNESSFSEDNVVLENQQNQATLGQYPSRINTIAPFNPNRPRNVFLCGHCAYITNCKASMDRHKLCHSDDAARGHKCTFTGCGMAFKRKDNLMRHATMHSEARPYLCPNVGCPSAFKRNEYLTKHKRSCKKSSHFIN